MLEAVQKRSARLFDGLPRLDQTAPAKESFVLVLDRKNWPTHVRWFLVFLLSWLAATAWYFFEAQRWGSLPGGSSLPGFTFGVAGGLIILFEMLLWPRKLRRSWRLGRVQVWMRAHIWLGLLCLPILVYHSGFRLGGWLSTVLLVLLVLVIASGVYGLILQNFLPARMLAAVPAETITSQIPHVLGQFRQEAERLVLAVCGPEESTAAPAEEEAMAEETAATGYLTLGAVRTAGQVAGRVVQTRSLGNPVPGSDPLRCFFQQTIEPYLSAASGAGSPLHLQSRSTVMFQELRTRLAPEAHDAVHFLEDLCQQRREFDLQQRLQFRLHSWLWIHLPLSVALVVLMALHIVVALKYW
jgi:hypothetical protein